MQKITYHPKELEVALKEMETYRSRSTEIILEHIRMEDIEKDVLIDLVYKHEVTIRLLRKQLGDTQTEEELFPQDQER